MAETAVRAPELPDEVVARLEAYIRRRLNGRMANFELIRFEGGVLLRGRATAYYTKQLAQHFVMQAIALPIVANQIEVYRSQEDGQSAP